MENWTDSLTSNRTSSTNQSTLIVGIFYVVFTLIMFLPYLCCMGILVKEQKAASSKAFYTLAVHMGVVDISQLVLNGFYSALRCFRPGWTPPLILENCVIAPLTACWFSYTMLAQYMALNRFCSVWYVTRVESIFLVSNTRWMLVSCYVYGAVHGIVRATPLVHLYYDPKVYAILYDQSPGSQMALKVNGILNYIHSGALCFWYSLIYIRLLLNKRKIAAAGVLRHQNNDNRENKVLLQSVVICMSDLLACSFWIFIQQFLRGHWVLFFADDLKKKESRLNILVLNAAYHGGYRLTEDGFEQTAGVNHLGEEKKFGAVSEKNVWRGVRTYGP
uniref:7TM GPCR serpentine receptor class x (Srx) domain-containing protein n=1 Tax=Romanomermis culicivorax TaxID=13658 RepID=A0A915IB10_ROMCU